MKSFLVRSFVLALLGSAALAASTEAQIKQRFAGRVAGLAVSVLDQTPNGGGKDVEIQIDMTTVRPRPRSASAERGGVLFTAFTQGEINSTISGLGGLGDGDILRRSSATDSSGRPFSSFLYAPRGARGDFYAGIAFYYLNTFRTQIEGELPGISFGDGATIEKTTLSPYGTPTTTTPGITPLIRSRWRGTFTHTYANDGAYTIQAASRCCPVDPVLSDDDDTMVQRGFTSATLFTGTRVYPNYPSQQNLTWNDLTVLVYADATLTDFRGTDGTFARSNNNTFIASTWDSQEPLGQVVNTAAVDTAFGGLSVLEVPTASTMGLLVLSLLLAGAGFIILRSGR